MTGHIGRGPGQGSPRGPGSGKPPAPKLDTSPEKQRERSFLAAKMRTWRAQQERDNPDWQGASRPPNRAEIETLARSYSPDALDALVEVVRNTRSAAVARVQAANALLDRGFGRARETVDLHATIEDMTADEARTELARELARLGFEQRPRPAITGPDQAGGGAGEPARLVPDGA